MSNDERKLVANLDTNLRANTCPRDLQSELDALIQEYAPQDKVSYVVARLLPQGGIEYICAHKAADVHASASMIKVLIMATLFHQARVGRLKLDEVVGLHEMPCVTGGGALQELIGPHEFTYVELCRLMMVLSDNWATNLLIHRLGFDTINEYAQSLGLKQTRLERLMMDFEARKLGRENKMTVDDLITLYETLYLYREEPRIGAEMWQILGRQQFRDKLPFYWDEEQVFYHKTGSLDDVEHDGGLLPLGSQMYGIGVFISNVPNAVGINLGALLGRTIKLYLELDAIDKK
ncbi:MAG: serine hydrolase [Veillonella caviae]|nr:serine hydrolase [Veillonella caviae]